MRGKIGGGVVDEDAGGQHGGIAGEGAARRDGILGEQRASRVGIRAGEKKKELVKLARWLVSKLLLLCSFFLNKD